MELLILPGCKHFLVEPMRSGSHHGFAFRAVSGFQGSAFFFFDFFSAKATASAPDARAFAADAPFISLRSAAFHEPLPSEPCGGMALLRKNQKNMKKAIKKSAKQETAQKLR